MMSVCLSELSPWIFCWVSYACRLVVSDLFNRNTDVFEYFKQSFSIMSECNRSVMWISSLDQYMTVETSHFRDCKYTDRTKGFCCNRKNFTVCNISAEFVVSSALQTIESDISRNNISFKSSVCNFYRESYEEDLSEMGRRLGS